MSNFTGYNEPTLIYYTNTKKLGPIDRDTKNPTRNRFYLKINNQGVVVPPHMDLTREKNLTSCKNAHKNGNSDYGTNGHVDCFTLIYKDGWKISEDYPW